MSSRMHRGELLQVELALTHVTLRFAKSRSHVKMV